MPAPKDAHGEGENGRMPRESRPIPDPTSLTTQQLIRETSALKELMSTRLEGMDRAIVLFNENITRVSTDADTKITCLREFILEKFETTAQKFESIQTQFKERDIRVEQTAKASKEALDAALQAAKEAVGKQNDSFAQSINKVEAAFTKQMDQFGVLLTSTVSALNDKIDETKGRLGLIEGVDRGKTHAVVTQQTAGMNSVSMMALVIGILSLLAGIVVGALRIH
jgi:hypothetical protein